METAERSHIGYSDGRQFTVGAMANVMMALAEDRTERLVESLDAIPEGSIVYADGDGLVAVEGAYVVGVVWHRASEYWGAHS